MGKDFGITMHHMTDTTKYTNALQAVEDRMRGGPYSGVSSANNIYNTSSNLTAMTSATTGIPGSGIASSIPFKSANYSM
jgi:hypothetical protein